MVKLPALRKFLVDRSALVTSWASLVIAVAALATAGYNARIEREFRELAIRPFLHLDVETSDFHVGFLNTGLGPAQVKRVALKFNPERCVVLFNRPRRADDNETTAADKLFDDVLTPIDNYFSDPLSQLVERTSIWEPAKYPKPYTRTLTPDEVISPNQEIVIFSFQKGQLEIAQKKLETLDASTYNEIIRRFVARAYSIPYYVDYCSLTGAFCANQIESQCRSAPQH